MPQQETPAASMHAEPYSISEEYVADDIADDEELVVSDVYPWQEAYVALLREYIELHEQLLADDWHSGWRFILHDFDRSGIPELLILGNQGVMSDSVAAYAFVDGEVMPLEIDRSIWLSFYAVPRNNQSGMIALHFSDGLFSYTDYKGASSDGWDLIVLDGNRLVAEITTEVVYFVSHYWEEHGIYYYIDGAKVTEAEFIRITESILGNWDDGFSSLGDWPADITEDNIQERIFGWKSVLTWQEAYAALLRDYVLSGFDEYMGWRFILHDFDLNGIPELLIFGNQGWRSESVAAYTFVDGEVLPLEIDQQRWTSFYAVPLDDGQGIIGRSFSSNLDSYMHYDDVVSVGLWNLITLDEGRLTTETIAFDVWLTSALWEERVVHYYIGGTKVTEAEFAQATQSLFGNWDYGIHRLGIVPDNVTEATIQERIFGWNSAPLTWQEAYASLLREYSERPVDWTWEAGLYFVLHDVDRDGIPELFVVKKNYSGHVRHNVYTFSKGEIVPLEPVELFGSLFVLPNQPGFMLTSPMGSGSGFIQMILDEGQFIRVSEGVYHLNDAGFEKEAGDNVPWQDTYYDLSIGGNFVTIEEFENVFGNQNERAWLSYSEISEANIQSIIFGWSEFTWFEGVIREIEHLTDDKLLVLVDSYPTSDDKVNFIVDQSSLVISVAEPEVGMRVHVFYETICRYLSSQYPLQIHAITFVPPYVVTSTGLQLLDGAGSFLGRFDENWKQISGSHGWSSARLEIGDHVEILFQDGSPFGGELSELTGRPLLVFFSSSVRYTFPQVFPTRIYVLLDT